MKAERNKDRKKKPAIKAGEKKPAIKAGIQDRASDEGQSNVAQVSQKP